MVRQVFRVRSTAIFLIGWVLSAVLAAPAETAAAVPKLDLNRYMGTWYEIARYPVKIEKHCVDNGTVLYALGNKDRTFQVGMFCRMKGHVPNEWDANGKMDKAGDGKLKITHIWPFSKKYWVLALGPSYEWALVGSPNHKSLWVLSRTPAMDPAVLSSIEATAAAQGFDATKLSTVPHGN